MNYQSSALWFYSGKVLLAAMVFAALALFGISASLLYLLIAGLIIPVATSMRLHGLMEQGVAWQRKSTSHWLIYLHGIPVQETRSDLTNPGFFSVDRARRFFLLAFGIKFVAQIAALILLLQQAGETQLSRVVPLLAALWLLYAAWRTLDALLAMATRRWLVGTLTTDSGSEWFHGYFNGRKGAHPALDCLLALL